MLVFHVGFWGSKRSEGFLWQVQACGRLGFPVVWVATIFWRGPQVSSSNPTEVCWSNLWSPKGATLDQVFQMATLSNKAQLQEALLEVLFLKGSLEEELHQEHHPRGDEKIVNQLQSDSIDTNWCNEAAKGGKDIKDDMHGRFRVQQHFLATCQGIHPYPKKFKPPCLKLICLFPRNVPRMSPRCAGQANLFEIRRRRQDGRQKTPGVSTYLILKGSFFMWL